MAKNGRNGSPPEKVFRIGFCSASVFANEVQGDGETRVIRSVNVQRSYREGDQTKYATSFGLADLPQVIRALQLAQQHVEREEAAVL